jgi:hypothetical protein
MNAHQVLFHGWFAPIALFLWWFLLLLSSLNVLPRAAGTIAAIAVFSVAGFVVTAALTDRWLLWRLVTYFEWAYISALALVFVGISVAQEINTVAALGLDTSSATSSSGSSAVSSTTVAAIVFPLVLWLQATLTLVSMDSLAALRSAKLRLVLLLLLIVDNCLIMFYDRVVRIPGGLIVPFPICTLYCTDSQCVWFCCSHFAL